MGGLTNGRDGVGEGVDARLRGGAEVVQSSALAMELAGLLELAIAFGPDLGLETEELVTR